MVNPTQGKKVCPERDPGPMQQNENITLYLEILCIHNVTLSRVGL